MLSVRAFGRRDERLQNSKDSLRACIENVNIKPWFGYQCDKSRKAYHHAKMHAKYPSSASKGLYTKRRVTQKV